MRSKPDTTHAVVQYVGECPLYSTLTPGATYYLSDTAPGAITDVAPTAVGSIVQEVGFARNATTLVISIDRNFVQL